MIVCLQKFEINMLKPTHYLILVKREKADLTIHAKSVLEWQNTCISIVQGISC